MSFLPHFLVASQVAPTALLLGDYTPWIVVLSVAMAVLASMAALQIAGVTQTSDTRLPRAITIASATFVLGAGIWSMHFIGMLAFRLCTAVGYAPWPTVLSMLPGLVAAFVAVLLLTRRQPSRAQRSLSGVLIGLGIATMHYSGMAAMRLAPELHYDPIWFGFSLVAGVGLSVLALHVQGGLVRLRWLSRGNASMAGGMVLGLAIACTHYIGMRAALFVGPPDPAQANAGPHTALVLGVALVALLVIGAFISVWGLLHYRALVLRLRTNEQRLQSVINGTVEGIVVLDRDGRIFRFNRSAECVTGHRAEAMLGQRLDALLQEPDATLAAYLAGEPLPDGTVPAAGVVREIVVRRPDGKLLDLRLSIGRVVVPGEQLFVAFLSDIGEQKQTERALREREAQYGALIRNIPGTFFRVRLDAERSALFVSEQIQSIVGFPASDFRQGGRTLTGLVHPDDEARVRAAAEAAAAAPGRHDYSFECRLLHADGSHRWVAANCEIEVPADGSTPCVDGVMIDITEAKLRAAEFEGTVRAIGHALAVVEFDTAGRVLEANENFLSITGYSRDEVLGQPHAIFCDPAYVASPGYREFWDNLRRGEAQIGEYERFGRDGHAVWLQASYNPVMGADGRLLKIFKFASDASARRAVQVALLDAKNRAEQAAAARTAFLANMSHEIRTPMNAVIGFTELLMDTPLSSVQRRHLETVRHSAGSLLGLLDGILDTAKLEKGAMELDLHDFSLHELATQVTDSLRIGANARGVGLELDYEGTLPERFRGDAMRLRQVLLNLISNGVKFTEAGTVRLVVRQREGAGGEPGRALPLHIAVHDTGIGIAADRLEAIFQPFAQADASMSRRFGGTGLGITIARQLVELMGGAIAVDSRLGEGSVFHVYLSLEPAAAAMPAPVASRAHAEQQPLSVLVVDDVRQNAELLRIALGAAGHTVAIATGGAAAVSDWAAGAFDVVLMDVHMPGMDGLEAVRRIRALEASAARPRTPIVALTASVLDEDRRAAREAGMDGFLAKPIDLGLLHHEMSRAVAAVVGDAAQAVPVPVAAPPASAMPAAVCDSDSAGAGAVLDLPCARDALDALRRGEIDAPALEATEQALRGRGDTALAAQLGDSVAEFDFARAAALLAALLKDPEGIAA